MEGVERNRPKFFPDVGIPHVPKDMIAVRFHGKLAFIPGRNEDEPLVGNSGFTRAQINALAELDNCRLEHQRSNISRGDSLCY